MRKDTFSCLRDHVLGSNIPGKIKSLIYIKNSHVHHIQKKPLVKPYRQFRAQKKFPLE